MQPNYNRTMAACFVGYITQAIVNNFAPLLFLTFQSTYGISLSQITLLTTFNFGVQLLVDLLSPRLIDRVGYRASAMAAHLLCALGLVLMTVLPGLLSVQGLFLAVMVYAVGGGLLEVLVSPIVEACPSEHKEAAMSLLHSFYCWGHVAVILFSTLFFNLFGIHRWHILACLWALVPIANCIAFARVPLAPLLPEGETGMTIRELARSGLFWCFLLLMLASGACEQAVSQWASAFAEQSLSLSKRISDLAGPLFFALTMGTARLVYGRFGNRWSLRRAMALSGAACAVSYLMISLSPGPVAGLIGCGLCGLSVGILWPGSFSLASAALPRGGTALFALLALGGDLGCTAGPTFVGIVSNTAGGSLRTGVACALIFPAALLAALGLYHIQQRRQHA